MTETRVEGELLIDLCWLRGRVARVAIHSTRPLFLPRIFNGKRPEDVVALLPLIYSVCGVAQGCAAAEALEEALAISVSPSHLLRRRLLVAFETLKEHIWRIELDWAGYCHRSPDRDGIARAVSLMKDFRAALFPQADPFIPGGVESTLDVARINAQLDDLEHLLDSRIFTQPTQSWLEISDRQGLGRWSSRRATLAQEMLVQVENLGAAGLGRTQIAALGEPDAVYLNQRLTAVEADDFILQPDFRGAPAETTPYTRRRRHPLLRSLQAQYGNGLLSRLTARLVELAALAGELRSGVADLCVRGLAAGSSALASGTGISQIEAARGRLVHRVEVEAGRVSNYQILAPTEWNFHPRGVLAGSLTGLEADTRASLEQRADLLINAIDPCVGYRLRIEQSEDGRPVFTG